MFRRGTVPYPSPIIILCVVAVLQLTACGDSDSDSPMEPTWTLDLRAESNLTADCYVWPTPDLSLPDAADYALPISVGDRAIDFTLEDATGEKYSLSELLETRPVLIVFGAYT